MVSDEVSVAVVDLLEMIPVKEQERAHLIGVCCHIFIDPLFTASSVQKSGDCVFFGQSGQMGYQFFMFHKRPPFRKAAHGRVPGCGSCYLAGPKSTLFIECTTDSGFGEELSDFS